MERVRRRTRKSMSFIPVKYKRDGYKLAGASLPLSTHNYLTLFSLAKGTTKSKLITQLINVWIASQSKKNTTNVLILDIIKRTNTIWRHRKDKEMPFIKFKEGVYFELMNKGLNEEQVDTILKGLKEK